MEFSTRNIKGTRRSGMINCKVKYYACDYLPIGPLVGMYMVGDTLTQYILGMFQPNRLDHTPSL